MMTSRLPRNSIAAIVTAEELLQAILGVYVQKRWSVNSSVYVSLRSPEAEPEIQDRLIRLSEELENAGYLFRQDQNYARVALNSGAEAAIPERFANGSLVPKSLLLRGLGQPQAAPSKATELQKTAVKHRR